ncbi:unnamed protein product, partial [Polarella glacialis]
RVVRQSSPEKEQSGEGLLEGFMRFMRTHRAELVDTHGLPILSPDPRTLGRYAAEAWKRLPHEGRLRYHEEALREYRGSAHPQESADEALLDPAAQRAGESKWKGLQEDSCPPGEFEIS